MTEPGEPDDAPPSPPPVTDQTNFASTPNDIDDDIDDDIDNDDDIDAIRELASQCVDEAISSVLGNIRSGTLKRKKHKSPAKGTPSPKIPGKARQQQVAATIQRQRQIDQYDRITRLLEMLSRCKTDEERAAIDAKLNEILDSDPRARQQLAQAREARQRAQAVRVQEKQRRQRLLEQRELARQRLDQEAQEAHLRALDLEKRILEERERKRHEMRQQRQKQRQQQRQDQIDGKRAAKALLKKVHRKTPLHKKLEQDFAARVVGPELAERKRRLEQIQKERGQIDYELLKQHETTFLRNRSAYLKQKDQERREESKMNAENVPQFSKSVYLERFEAELAKHKLEQKEREMRAKTTANTQKRYGELVREMFRPKVDPNSQARVDEQFESIHNRRLQVNDDYIKKVRADANRHMRSHDVKSSPKSQSNRQPSRSASTSSLNGTPTRVKPLDYLAERRRKLGDKYGQKREKAHAAESVHVLEKKALRLQNRVESLESQFEGSAPTTARFEESDQINDAYVKAIEMKLKLLAATSKAEDSA